MCPTAEAITPIASPWASPIAVRLPPWVAMIEPAPTKISVNVPTNSANPRCSMAERMPETLERGADGAPSRDAAARAGSRISPRRIPAERKAAHVYGHPQAQAPELPDCEPEPAHRRRELNACGKGPGLPGPEQ